MATTSMPARAPPFDYQGALFEYKNLKKYNNKNEKEEAGPSKSLDQEPIIIEDSELEDGEIVEEEDKSFENLIRESCAAVNKSRNLRSSKLSSKDSNELFYEDKNVEQLKGGKVPLYNSSILPKQNESSNEVICLDGSTQSMSDDSIIVISDTIQSPKSQTLQKPLALSTPTINKLFQKIPVNSTPQNKKKTNASNNNSSDKILKKPAETSPRKTKRALRVKNYIAKKKLMIAAAASQLASQQPSTSGASSHQANGNSENVSAPANATPNSFQQNNNPASNSSKHTEENFISIDVENKEQTVTSKPIAQSQPPTVKEKRLILIDGSNVALSYTASKIGKLTRQNEEEFSAEGLKIVIDHFLKMNFKVKAFVPEFRVNRGKSSNHELMNQMKDSGVIVLTPSRSYDDLMLMQSAMKLDAAVVSNDFFRDIRLKHKDYVPVIEKRQIRYNWVFDELFLTEDPYGRKGPTLNEILYK